ncbi:hypothetical protein COLO4_19144 [Corchorus olitorius]|uniref:F-box domain-containing protein n=1 Tax=Corchorus olitorius TaxID=93759 RepID=A0A1R3J6N5_9ROSI|nr:hypothetical protein COLO4_19144 [Corchorus olitorius]
MAEKNLICTSTDQLPLDEILSRLPVKSLLRFKCVCKSWRILIEGPTFIALHLNRFEKNNDSRFLFFTDGGSYGDGAEYFKCSLKGKKISGEILYMGSLKAYTVALCDGLICQASRFCRAPFLFDILHIWNPSTRKVMLLPICPASAISDFRDFGVFLGFGLCPESNDYKVVRLTYFRTGGGARSRRLEVCSVSKNSWEKNITAATTFTYSSDRWHSEMRGTIISGGCHWLVTLDQEAHMSSPSPQYVILSYKFGEEVVQETKVPINFEDDGICGIREYEGSVSLISQDEGKFNVWVMKEFGVAESWVKQVTIQVQVRKREHFRVIGFRNNGQQVILAHRYSGGVICHDNRGVWNNIM